MSAVFLILDRQPRPVGFFTGLVGVMYGGIRICVGAFTDQPLRFLGGSISVLIGLLVWTAMLAYAQPPRPIKNRMIAGPQ